MRLSLSRSSARQQKRRLQAVATLQPPQPQLAMPPTLPIQKLAIAEQVPGSLTAHLLPIVAFLKAQGNTPAPALSYAQQNPDGFNFDRDGLGTFRFEKPLDVEALKAAFDFPPTVNFTRQGDLWDSRNRVGISRSRPLSVAEAAINWD